MTLASGSVPVQYGQLSEGFKGTDETVAIMAKMAMSKYGAYSPKIRALARNILNQAGVPQKDYVREAYTLARWVRDNIRYIRDPYGQETVAYPEETAFNMVGGDCDDQCVLLAALLAAVGIPSRFKVMGVTPMSYSHVYLQAQPTPGGKWVTFDPIMQDEQPGWEVPKSRRAVEKTYGVNGPRGIEGPHGAHQGGSMSGLGYVGDPRVVSHLEEPTIPYRAGTGQHPPRAKGRPAYVTMPSMLDTDVPVDHLMAFPPNANIPAEYPRQRAHSIAPELMTREDQQLVAHRTVRPGEIPPPIEGFDEDDYRADVLTPERMMAADRAALPPDNMAVPAYMQTKTVVAAPEPVDMQFSRSALVVDPAKQDKVEYFGTYSRAEKPPVYAYQGVAGERSMIPGMGMLDGAAGPGLAEDATGTQVDAGLPAQPPIMIQTPPTWLQRNRGLVMLGAIAAAAALLLRKK